MKSEKASDAPNKSEHKENTVAAKQHSPAALATPNSNKKARILASKSPSSHNKSTDSHLNQDNADSPLRQLLRHYVPSSNDIVLEYKDSGFDSRPLTTRKLPSMFHESVKKNLKAYYSASSKQRHHIVHKVALEIEQGGCRFLQSSILGNDSPPIEEPQAYHTLNPRASIVADFVEDAFAKYHVTKPGKMDIVCGEKRSAPESARLIVHKHASKKVWLSDEQVSVVVDEMANTGHRFLFAIMSGKSYIVLDKEDEEVAERIKKTLENCYYHHYKDKKASSGKKKSKQVKTTSKVRKKKTTSKARSSVEADPATRRTSGRQRKKPSYNEDSLFVQDPSPKRHKHSSDRSYSTSPEESETTEDPMLDAKIQKLKVGSLVAVYWENCQAYFGGEITKYTLTVKGEKNKFYIEYEDLESEWFDPRERKWFFTMDGPLFDESLPPSPMDANQAVTGLATTNTHETLTSAMLLFPINARKLTQAGVTEDNIGFIRGSEYTTFQEARQEIQNDLVPDPLPADAQFRFVLPMPMNCPVAPKQEQSLKVVEMNRDKSSSITIEILEKARQG